MKLLLNDSNAFCMAPASPLGQSKSRYRVNAFQPIMAAPTPIHSEEYLSIVADARSFLQTKYCPMSVAQHFLKARGIDPIHAASEFGVGNTAFAKQYTPLKPAEKRPWLPVGISIPSYRNGELVSVKMRVLAADKDSESGYCSKYMLLKDCPQVPYILVRNRRRTTPVLIVESELDAILLAQQSGDLFNYIALGSASAKPDVDVADLIGNTAKVYFCPDYDEAGMEAFNRWKRAFPKIQLAMLPKGKDPTEAWEAKVDLKKWVEELRMGKVPPITTREQKFRYTTIGSQDEYRAFLQDLRSVQCTRIAVEYDPAHGLIAFSDGDENTAVGHLENVCIDWASDMEGLSLVSFEPARLYRDIPALRQLKVSGILDLFHALTGHGKDMELAELSSRYLGPRGGLPDAGAEKTFSDEQITAGNARSVAARVPILLHIPRTSVVAKYFHLLQGASKALGEIMANGLLIDRESFERGGGWMKARGIWTYCDEDGRVRGRFSPYGTITGRLVCSDPNLQSFPNDLKHTVIAPQGRVLVDADYRQSEMRIAAILAKDETMLNALSAGKDIHRETASRILHIPSDAVTYEQRQIGKAVNFGFLYGQKGKGLQSSLEELRISKTLEECSALQDSFAAGYPSLRVWAERLLTAGQTPDWRCPSFPPTGIRTALRRRIPIYSLDYRHKTKVVNYAVQGSGAELTLQVLGLLPERLAGLDAKIIHCIHDEFLLEAAEDDAEQAATILAQTMTEAFTQLFPDTPTGHLLDCGIGKTWAEAKKQ